MLGRVEDGRKKGREEGGQASVRRSGDGGGHCSKIRLGMAALPSYVLSTAQQPTIRSIP